MALTPEMLVQELRACAADLKDGSGGDEIPYRLLAFSADEIERLRRIEKAASSLKFCPYPAHGSGFVMMVSEGNIDHLATALETTN